MTYQDELETIKEKIRGTQDNSRQIKTNLRQFETNQDEPETIQEKTRQTLENLRKIQRNSR